MHLYAATQADYEYFMDFYWGRPTSYGYEWWPENKPQPTIEEFQAAVRDFQIGTKEPWQEFASFEREFVRDQLLFNAGLPIVGLGIGDDPYAGEEHLRPVITVHSDS